MKRATNLATMLFGEAHQRLLGLLLLRPEQSFHARELARLASVDAGNAHRKLKRMEQAGLLSTARQGNQVRYQANRACPIFNELAGIMRKTSGMADILRDALAGLAERIDFALIFGSVARGEEGPHSDVDVLVVGDLTFEEVVAAVHGTSQQIGRAVNPVLMMPADFEQKRAANDRFVARITAEPKLILLGAMDES